MIVPPALPLFNAGAAPTSAQLNTLQQACTLSLYKPVARLLQSTAQSIPYGSFTAITFDFEVLDTDGMHSTATNTSRLTCVTPGSYEFNWSAAFSVNATGRRVASLYKNGAAIRGDQLEAGVNAASSGPTVISGFDIVPMAVGDYVETYVFQTVAPSGALPTLTTNPSGSTFTAEWLRA